MATVNGRAGEAENSRIRRIIEDLRKAEKAQEMRERRAAERQPFVRPVEIALGRNRDVVMKAMSNTISHLGIGVVHDVPIDVGRIAVLTILRMHETPLRVRAECRWCNEYSSQWYASGWKFIAEEQ